MPRIHGQHSKSLPARGGRDQHVRKTGITTDSGQRVFELTCVACAGSVHIDDAIIEFSQQFLQPPLKTISSGDSAGAPEFGDASLYLAYHNR